MRYKDLLKIYGDVEMHFRSYYKYSFHFTGEFKGETISVSVGGHPDDIYRTEIKSVMTFRELEPDFIEIDDTVYDFRW